ncbi:MAG: type II secretion system GspH family protein [Candidatus Fibromonas sp.]|jgi:type II secretory pathway pseudopilin PulG|nr:type II secretion system GspH family protein [Candidatus Fibromonas sp.]
MTSQNSKRGFGILEVLIASLVLGFLIVGLLYLQKGNREAILRIRARDAANYVATHVLDSIAATGMKAIEKNCASTDPKLIYCNSNYKYVFEGKPQMDKKTPGIKPTIDYTVEVFIQDSSDPNNPVNPKIARDTSFYASQDSDKDTISQSLNAVVSWSHKNSRQSISVAKVVR